MNKLFTKIAALALGMTMATGVGVAVATSSKANAAKPVAAETDSITYNFSNKSWAASPGNWVSGKDGASFESTGNARGIQVTTAASGANATSPISFSTITNITVGVAKSSSGVGTVTAYVGSTSVGSTTSFTTSTQAWSCNVSSLTGTVKINVACTTNSIYVKYVSITYEKGGGGDNQDVITASDLAATTTSYTSFSNVSKSSGAKYLGKTAKDSSGNIQCNNTSGNGIASSDSPGKIKSISISWGTTPSSGRGYNVYGSNTAYTAVSTSGTSLGSLDSSTTSINVSGDYKYVSLQGKGGATYAASITFNWEITYTVSFNLQGHGSAITNQTIASGGKVTQPTNPSATGYTFGGWYKEAACTNAWNFSTDTVTADTTLYAKWTIISYTVSFNVQGHGTAPANQSISYGGKVTQPTNPSATGYTFGGWYKEAACTNAWNFSTDTVTSAKTLYAKWTIITFTVTSDIENGSLDDTSSIDYNGDLAVQIQPNSGYDYPNEITVTMGGNDITSSVDYDPTDGSILYEGVTGNIVVSASCPVHGHVYSISADITNGNSSGDEEIAEEGEATIVITPSTGYKTPLLKSDVTVTNALVWDYIRTSNSSATISILGAEGDIEISATCPALDSYQISVTASNASYSGPSSIQEDGSAVLVFTPDSGFGQPADVTVTGATKSWNSGTLTLTNPTGTVYVDYAAATNQLDSISLNKQSGNYILGDPLDSTIVVTAHYTLAADAVVTPTSVTGYDPYTTGSHTVTFSYTEGGVTRTATYTATVAAASVTTITTWELTDLANLTSTDEFVIARTSSTTVALPNNGGAAKPTASSVTISNNKITSEVTDSLLWNVSGNASDGYVFNPKGSNNSWLYLLDDANDGVRIGTGANKHFTLNQGYLYTEETTSPRMVGVYNDADWRCYKLTSDGKPGSNIADQTFGFFRKVETQVGSATLIRIVCDPSIDSDTGYKGGEKEVGDKVRVSDFVVKKQLDTGNDLTAITNFTINGGTEYTLESTSNNITISYTEGGITETTNIVVSANEREAELVSVSLIVGENAKLDGYVAWSGAEWDLTDITVAYHWTDEEYDSEVDLQDLVDLGDATLSPATPTVGATSFTVSYEYMEVELDDSTVYLDEAVVADYVESVSWSGKSLAHFKAYSGAQLTASTVQSWTVKATYAGAGESAKLDFGTASNQFTIKVGSKSVTSLPYTWSTEDDGAFIAVVVGGVAKEDHTYAVANICATINAIDHEETHSGEQTLENFVDTSSETWNVVKAGVSGGGDDSELEIRNAGFTFASDNGYWAEGNAQIRSYKDSSFTISSSYTIKSISFTFSGSYNGGLEASYTGINASSKTFSELSAQARITSITIVFEGSVTTVVHYANQMEHFDAQKAVVKFAKAFNTAMNASNVCEGTHANLEAGWANASAAYSTFLNDISSLDVTEQDWAKAMLSYATAAWGSDAEAACVEKAMATYEYVVRTYKLNAFMDSIRPVERATNVNPISVIGTTSNNAVAIIVIVSLVSAAAVGGYFFIRKRKEN